MEAEIIDAKVERPSIETVNTHLLTKLDELIQDIDVKTNPEMVKVITESLAKLNTSLRGNDIFTPKETDEERKERESREAILDAMSGNT